MTMVNSGLKGLTHTVVMLFPQVIYDYNWRILMLGLCSERGRAQGESHYNQRIIQLGLWCELSEQERARGDTSF